MIGLVASAYWMLLRPAQLWSAYCVPSTGSSVRLALGPRK